tara:strand:+ start:13947 stop:14999 length:1053 start_codon:yes stop_codon:yes gene_type:complete
MANKPKKYGNNNIVTRNTLLIDGNALFKVGFHGAKDMYNSEGNHIGGLYQFITIIRKLLREDLYHRVFVFWDGEFSGKMRYNVYKDYKSGRGKNYEEGTAPIDAQERIEKFLITQYLEELCVRQLVDDSEIGVEADDLIAYYCKTKKKNEKITICTGDRDLCQLINDDVKMYLIDKKIYLTKQNYSTFFKHHQENLKLIKVICGDASDSIKGVQGVKEPTLLKYFPEFKNRKVELKEVISSALDQQEERTKNKLKPLKALTNIICGITTGVQGNKLYEINDLIIDLENPLIDDNTKEKLNELKGPIGDMDNRGIKNVYNLMKRDGLAKEIYNFSTEYLLPFKELIEREKK